jgi:hypothetical protein
MEGDDVRRGGRERDEDGEVGEVRARVRARARVREGEEDGREKKERVTS